MEVHGAESLPVSKCVFMTSKPVMAVDVGSNAIRMKIHDASGSLVRKRFKVRLGFDVFDRKTVQERTINQLIHALGECHTYADQFGADRYRVVATSALRNAKNARQVIRAVKNETGYRIDLIDGLTEASLIFEAVRRKVTDISGRCLLIDIGGGSVELVGAKGGKVVQVKSFKIGTVRTLLEARRRGWGVADIREMMADKLGDCLDHWRTRVRSRVGVGTGGNFRAIGKASGLLNRGSRSITCGKLLPFLSDLIGMTESERVDRLGFSANRAEVCEPAAIVIQLIIESLALDRLYLPKIGLVDGVLLDLQEGGENRIRPLAS